MVVSQRSLLGTGEPAVDSGVRFERMQLDEKAWIDLARAWLRGADTLFDALIDGVEWRQGRRWMYERMVDDPRLSCWYGPDEPLPHKSLETVKHALEAHYAVPFGSVGLNYYRDGRDSVAFHRDRELRRVDDSLVAIVTLGARRPFLVRRRGGGPSRDLAPAAGDLLVMGGSTQREWEHNVPKVAHSGPRISMTWRWC
jgi:alkylated DNA repair dioxygenase AlkB